MSKERLYKLLEFYNEDPHDPFNIYALATEYLKTDKLKSLEFFRILLKDFPTYLPTYYHAAALMEELKFWEEAEEVYKNGIKQCKDQNNQHLLRELKNAWSNFEFNKDE